MRAGRTGKHVSRLFVCITKTLCNERQRRSPLTFSISTK
jgi:hypothetical protein